MKAWISIIFLTVAVYLIAGGGYRDIVTDQEVLASVSEVKKEARDVFRATKKLVLEAKDSLRDRLKSDLMAVKRDMRRLRKEMKKASGKEKKELKRQLARLKKEEKALKKKLKKLGAADRSFWGRIKGGYRKVLDGVSDMWESFMDWFR